jgi:hypothetical protein
VPRPASFTVYELDEVATAAHYLTASKAVVGY